MQHADLVPDAGQHHNKWYIVAAVRCVRRSKKRPDCSSGPGRFPCREVAVTTFATPTPITRQITYALTVLRNAREDGDCARIYVAAQRLDRLLARYRCTRTLAEMDPELDARLRVAWK